MEQTHFWIEINLEYFLASSKNKTFVENNICKPQKLKNTQYLSG